ncbi:hypothetical protein DPMN_125019 [Dreissena polymorpha]|uniref:Uncharacterized protein n=1 Tax=Dreissena polymorpha TaxID=45954 RepID=A0A9D4JSQ0_DREPO|nr:hypothetical protein DPMN_125019 [Dreissena polymorpha]
MSLNEMVKLKRKITLKHAIEQSKYSKYIALDMDTFKIDGNVMRSLFNNTIEKVVAHVRKLLQSHLQVSHILLAGGFSESQLLQEAMRQSFPDNTIVVPPDAGLAVLKGAVIHGHNKNMISSRKAKYTYGVKIFSHFKQNIHSPERRITEGPYMGFVRGCFDKLIEINQDVKGETVSAQKTYHPLSGNKNMTIKLFCSEDANPTYVDDQGCFYIGSLNINCADENENISTALFFGDTELRVTAVDSSGKELSATFQVPN